MDTYSVKTKLISDSYDMSLRNVRKYFSAAVAVQILNSASPANHLPGVDSDRGIELCG